ncbi:MAG: hypothetical protein R3E66_04970 [bacterium]
MRRFWIAVVLVLAGCGSCDDEAGSDAANNASNNGTTGSNNSNNAPNNGADTGADGMDAGQDADAADPDADSRQDYCLGDGPPILNPGTPDELCTGDVAAVSFRFAMCSCEGFVTSGTLTTSSINSTGGTSGQSASVGTNGKFDSTGVVDIGGSLWASGDGGVTMSNAVTVSGDLRSGGGVASGQLDVGRNLDLEGNLVVQGDATVGSELRQPTAAMQTVSGTLTATQVRGPVDIAQACDCSTEQLLPIRQIVTSVASANDNAEVGFDSEALRNLSAPVTLDVPCGRLYLSGIDGGGDVTLNVNGRVALFVGGDVSVSGQLTIHVPAGSQLDLFLGGNFNAANDVVIGDPDRPAATRIYVGGTGTVAISANVSLNANLYAPEAELVLAASTVIRGSVFARRIATSGDLGIVYDEAILEAGEDCETPGGGPKTCDSCRDCANQACSGGTCSDTCTSSDQCCSGLICMQGRCGVIL